MANKPRKFTPLRTDVVDALIYLIDMGYPPDHFRDELLEIKPTLVEVNELIRIRKIALPFLPIVVDYL